MAEEILGYDYSLPSADGTDNVTTAIRELLNSYPDLQGDEIMFSTLDTESSKAMFPLTSVAILREVQDVTAHVSQVCIYPFIIIFRTKAPNENRRAFIKEWLDNLGRWLEKQTVNGQKLEVYPLLTGDRKFTKFSRQSPAYLYATTEDKTEDWAIEVRAEYTNEFDR